MIFLQDNETTFFDDRQKLIQLGLEILNHLPFSPDTAPLDVHLF